jgi:Holliday junction resolvase RusA-like endonuclease
MAALARYELEHGKWPRDARYHVTVSLYFGDKRRRDADNCAKAAADALNPKGGWGGVWNDDSQIDSLLVIRNIDRERPRTLVTVHAKATA